MDLCSKCHDICLRKLAEQLHLLSILFHLSLMKIILIQYANILLLAPVQQLLLLLFSVLTS
jgi:hypothetical protein